MNTIRRLRLSGRRTSGLGAGAHLDAGGDAAPDGVLVHLAVALQGGPPHLQHALRALPAAEPLRRGRVGPLFRRRRAGGYRRARPCPPGLGARLHA
eukprot:6981035-Pyramimonas_sp.AAC.1